MEKGKIIYYVSKKGDCPIQDFLDSLSYSQQTKILRIFSYIKEYGLQAIIPHIKKLTGIPLWEIRILGKDNIRIIYLLEYRNLIIILHGFIKKTQKTEKQDINIALSRYYDSRIRKIVIDK